MKNILRTLCLKKKKKQIKIDLLFNKDLIVFCKEKFMAGVFSVYVFHHRKVFICWWGLNNKLLVLFIYLFVYLYYRVNLDHKVTVDQLEQWDVRDLM